MLHIPLPVAVHHLTNWKLKQPIPLEADYLRNHLNSCKDREFTILKAYLKLVIPDLTSEDITRFMCGKNAG